jgi:hypothetical protein
MSQTSTIFQAKGPLGRRPLLPLALGTFAILALVLTDGGLLEAQAKKETKAAAKSKKDGDESKEETKETPKKEIKYVQNIPPVTDKLLTSQGVEQVAKINELIKQNWINNKVNPSARCSDYEFIRRASLDIIGRIATEKEVLTFVNKQPAETRRSWLIEELLKSKEFGENFANIWTVMLLTRTNSQKFYQEMLRDWLTERFNDDKADWSKITYDILTAKGKDNDNAAVLYFAHNVGEEIRQDTSKKGRASEEELRSNGKWDMVPVTSRTTRLFLGLRTQCVQCHDHPFNGEWFQSNFWGINAFFRQTDISQRPTMMMAKKKGKGVQPVHVEVHDNKTYNEKGVVSYERRSAVLLYTGMQFLDGTRVKTDAIPADGSRRTELGKLVTKSPYFGKVFVNRMWAHFFGKSFTKDAADDFGEHNPVTNPELLDYLGEEFAKKYNHSPKDVVRWICNSQAYGLSSRSNPTNDKPDDEVLFARMLPKSMTPEQLFDSLMTATASKASEDKDVRRGLREKWLDTLVLNFGNDEGEEGTFSGTVVQALMLMNGKDINDAIMDQNVGTVANVNRAKGLTLNKDALDKLYLAALNRKCSNDEWTKLQHKDTYSYFTRGASRPGTPAFNAAYYQDIFWALLNSSEFILNH